MDASKYQFDHDKIATLHYYRDNQFDARLKVRFIALLMLAEGLELEKIASIIGKSSKAIEKWYFEYATKGINSLNVYDQEKFEQKLVNRVTHSLLVMVEGTGQIVPLHIAFDQE